MKFQKGDIVLVGGGKVHWEVFAVHAFPKGFCYALESGMSGRTRYAWETELKPWTPGA